MGLDASTNSMAYCIFDGDKVVEYGEIFFTGADLYDRLLDAKRKVKALKERFNCNFVAIENNTTFFFFHPLVLILYYPSISGVSCVLHLI